MRELFTPRAERKTIPVQQFVATLCANARTFEAAFWGLRHLPQKQRPVALKSSRIGAQTWRKSYTVNRLPLCARGKKFAHSCASCAGGSRFFVRDITKPPRQCARSVLPDLP